MMSKIGFLVLMYLAVLGMLMGFTIYLLNFADTANFNQTWVESTLPMLVDLMKIVIGAVVGSLSATGVMIFEAAKTNRESSSVVDTETSSGEA